tara:strand:+ start:266 stop:463 length:198 start_codon:yes stop_codon:yes gene_type:complete
MKPRIDIAINLAEYIHELALKEDEVYKINMIASNKATAAEGESGMVFHSRTLLNVLKELKSENDE